MYQAVFERKRRRKATQARWPQGRERFSKQSPGMNNTGSKGCGAGKGGPIAVKVQTESGLGDQISGGLKPRVGSTLAKCVGTWVMRAAGRVGSRGVNSATAKPNRWQSWHWEQLRPLVASEPLCASPMVDASAPAIISAQWADMAVVAPAAGIAIESPTQARNGSKAIKKMRKKRCIG